MDSVFTTIEEIERLFSEVGVELRLDDGSDTAPTLLVPSPLYKGTIIDEIISDASEFIWQYTWTRYLETQLTNNKWVRRRATYIACHFLSMRRGNPGQFIDRFELIKEELQLVYSEILHIPDATVSVSSKPVISNHVIDNRGYGPVQRVTRDSTGGYTGQRTTDANPYPEII